MYASWHTDSDLSPVLTGAERGAMFYSLVCSCRLNGVNFFEYISDVINKAAALPPNTPLEKYRMLLPDKWKENR